MAITILALSAGCSEEDLPAGARAGGFNLADAKKQSQVIEILKERDIPYQVNSRGLTVYMLEDQAEVLSIIRKVQYDGNLDEKIFESAIVQGQEFKERYIDEFESASIPFFFDTVNGLEHIFWSQIHGPIVDKIRQKINIQIREKARQRAEEEGFAPITLIGEADQ